MSGCFICPRNCGVNRAVQPGYCGAGLQPHVALAAKHMWEEPYLSGTSGSGAIFFCGCNMDCVFCQNHAISHSMIGEEVTPERLAQIMLELEAQGAHNINLVTPTPHINTLIPALERAKALGLGVPVAYNTNAYEHVSMLARLSGLVDIYLPDIKYVSPQAARRYSCAEDYFYYASRAVLEMKRQVGQLCIGPNGLATKGLAVRHLVLPGSVDEARGVMDFVCAQLGAQTHVSIMAQYYPCHRANFAPLNRRLLDREYKRAADYCALLGMENVLVQELAAASETFTPNFFA